MATRYITMHTPMYVHVPKGKGKGKGKYLFLGAIVIHPQSLMIHDPGGTSTHLYTYRTAVD